MLRIWVGLCWSQSWVTLDRNLGKTPSWHHVVRSLHLPVHPACLQMRRLWEPSLERPGQIAHKTGSGLKLLIDEMTRTQMQVPRA